jgi:hypothetical protein
METLIELIVRGLIALFSGGGKYDKNRPPQRPVPPPIPQQQQYPQQQYSQQYQSRQGQRLSPQTQRAQQQRMQQQRLQQQRIQQKRQPLSKRAQQQLLRKSQQRPGQRQMAPPPIPAPAPPPTPHLAPAPPTRAVAPATAQPAITAKGIRNLMLTRKSALRTIYVLSEVVGPPLSLR